MFTKPNLTTPKRPDQDRCDRDHNRYRGKDHSANASAKRPIVTLEYNGPYTRQLPTECQALLTSYTGIRFPPMSTARKAANIKQANASHTQFTANAHGAAANANTQSHKQPKLITASWTKHSGTTLRVSDH